MPSTTHAKHSFDEVFCLYSAKSNSVNRKFQTLGRFLHVLVYKFRQAKRILTAKMLRSGSFLKVFLLRFNSLSS
jgi:hypothetical protein